MTFGGICCIILLEKIHIGREREKRRLSLMAKQVDRWLDSLIGRTPVGKG